MPSPARHGSARGSPSGRRVRAGARRHGRGAAVRRAGGDGRPDRRRRRAAVPRRRRWRRAGDPPLAGRREPATAATRGWLVTGLVGAFLAAGAALVLSGTDFPPLGIALDQGFRAASVTKYAHTLALVDFAYKDLPAFYPPLFFWVLGRGAAWLGVEPYEALKARGARLRGRCAARRRSRSGRGHPRSHGWRVAVAVGALAFQDWYEPYAWLAVVVFVPWWLRSCSRWAWTRPPRRAATVVRRVADRRRVRAAPTTTSSSSAPCTWLAVSRSGAPRRARGVVLGPRRARDDRHRARRRGVAQRRLLAAAAGRRSSRTPGARSMQNRYLDATRRSTCRCRSSSSTSSAGSCCSASGTSRSRMFRSRAGRSRCLAARRRVRVVPARGPRDPRRRPAAQREDRRRSSSGPPRRRRARRRGRRARSDAAHAASPSASAPGGCSSPLVVGAAVSACSRSGTRRSPAIPYVDEQRAATEPVASLATSTGRPRGDADDTVVLTDLEQFCRSTCRSSCSTCGTRTTATPRRSSTAHAGSSTASAREQDPEVFAAALRAQPLRRRRLGRVLATAAATRFPTRSSTTPSRAACQPAHVQVRGRRSSTTGGSTRARVGGLAVYVPRRPDPLAALDDEPSDDALRRRVRRRSREPDVSMRPRSPSSRR